MVLRGRHAVSRSTVATLALSAVVWASCDDGGDDTFNRVSEKGAGDGGSGSSSGDPTPDGATPDGAAGDASVGPSGPLSFVTGSAPNATAAVGYGDHTCVVAGADRSVYCWGANDHGQLGNGLTGAGTYAQDVATATKIAGDENGVAFTGIDELSASGFHNCARRGDVLYCWGERFSGAQAEPPANPATDRTKPRAIGNLAVKAIAAGGAHTCALNTNGKFTCFGHSYFNELGRARATDPVCTSPLFYAFAGDVNHTCSSDFIEATANLPSAHGVVAGEIHTCSLANGFVFCWGNNTFGQLGVAGAQAGELNAQQVLTDLGTMTPLDQVSMIATGGGRHTCALRAGKVLCWGSNRSGELGVDPAMLGFRSNAVEAGGITDATAIGAADGITCAVRTGGSVWCWGAAESGQIGGDAGVAFDAGVVAVTPVQIKGAGGIGNLTDVVSVAPGNRHVCARKVDSTVWCWGKNDRGQLGDGSKVDSANPVKVTGLP